MSLPATPPSFFSGLFSSFRQQFATWLGGAVFAIVALFSGKITESIKLHLDVAKLRVSNYESLSKDLSSFAFQAELIQEFLEHNWTQKATLTELVKGYNESVTQLREKEYVYIGWLDQYWGKEQADRFEKTIMENVRAVDKAIHSINKEIGEVTVMTGQGAKTEMNETVAKGKGKEIKPSVELLSKNVREFILGLR